MPGLTVWFTGLSSSGKTTISQAVRERLSSLGHRVEWLDGDVVRKHISKGLGYSKEDRDENIRRIGFVAELLDSQRCHRAGSAISPYRAVRGEMRALIGNFLEVYVQASLETCRQRDINGVYRRAQSGEISHVTGLDDPYEPPLAPDVLCRTDQEPPDVSVQRVLDRIESWMTRKN